jgi:hypothetical protein
VPQATEGSPDQSLDLNNLSGPQRALLREALLLAFSRDALDRMLQDNDASKRLDILAKDSDLRTQIFDVVSASQDDSWTDALVVWAQKARPNHTRIKDLVSELRMIEGVEGSSHLTDFSLEKTVKARSDTLEFGDWLMRLAKLRGNVCRIEDPRDQRKALGTGFLVAPDLLLTNYHVLENYLSRGRSKPKLDVGTLAFRFDYAIESSGENYGKLVGPAANGWLVSSAPYSTARSSGELDLDYALLRLAKKVGTDKIGNERRGWLLLSSLVPAPKKSEVVFIAQHPRGAPLKMAVGTVLGTNGGHIRYDTETQGGSSGSPCLDAVLQLVALHQGSDGKQTKKVNYNEGIAIDAIIGHLASRGVPKFWI